MKLDDDKEAREALKNGLGAYGNRMRAVFNRGYIRGFEDGKREAIQMLERSLMDLTTADRKKDISYSDHTDYKEPKTYVTWTEPQTDCPWK